VLMQHVLLAAGYVVDVAATAKAALSLLDSRRYHLVLTDDRLPDGRGVHIAEVARERETRAVVITGYALRSSKGDLERYDHLLKPVRPAELVEAVEQRLGGDRKPSSPGIA
jgi:CheY-like chemotaxis protein